MKILRFNGKLVACFSAKEIANLLVLKFFTKLFSKEELKNEPYDSETVFNYIRNLSNQTIDSTDYEFYTAILELYDLFENKCEICFNLKTTFDPQINKITSIKDLYSYREDPPDIIIRHEGKFYEFELKRYRDKFNFDELLSFLKNKIIMHYSGRYNFLIILQLKPYSNIDLDIFKQLHEKLKLEKNQPGIIAFSLNKNNEEMLLVRILPDLNISKRPHSEINSFSEILNSE